MLFYIIIVTTVWYFCTDSVVCFDPTVWYFCTDSVVFLYRQCGMFWSDSVVCFVLYYVVMFVYDIEHVKNYILLKFRM